MSASLPSSPLQRWQLRTAASLSMEHQVARTLAGLLGLRYGPGQRLGAPIETIFKPGLLRGEQPAPVAAGPLNTAGATAPPK